MAINNGLQYVFYSQSYGQHKSQTIQIVHRTRCCGRSMHNRNYIYLFFYLLPAAIFIIHLQIHESIVKGKKLSVNRYCYICK